jgi:hypothetical protein
VMTSAPAQGLSGFTVYTLPLSRTRSAGGYVFCVQTFKNIRDVNITKIIALKILNRRSLLMMPPLKIQNFNPFFPE